jgi:hypothetical protein
LTWFRLAIKIEMMSTNPFVEQRQRLEAGDRLASVVATLPSGLRETNAVPLMAIVRELEASSVIEIGVIHAVTRANVEDPQAIKTQRTILEDYRDRRLHDRDRTHCSNISRIRTQLQPVDGASGGSAEFEHLGSLLSELSGRDDDLLDDVERILTATIAAIIEIDQCRRVDDAQAAQERFAKSMQPTIDAIKSNLSLMNKLAGELIDSM